MRERDLSGVSQKRLRELEVWLAMKTGHTKVCPFEGLLCYLICRQVFPKLERARCPCRTFQVGYVKGIVRKLIKELS